MVGLAVNSAKDRSQNQLHIHIDCIRSDIRNILRSQENVLDDHWSELTLGAPDHPYMVMKLATESLNGINPFQLLADGISRAEEHTDLETLVVVGAVFKDGKRGFYLLSSRHRAGTSAHGEDLLAPNCRVADLSK
jgi:CDP-diacylglycerol pyrophosphatase